MAGFEGLASQTWSSESDDEPPEKMARSSVSQLEATDGGSILRRGIRFDSEEDFAKFVGQKAKKSKRAKKKKRRKDVDGNSSTIDEGPKMCNGEGFDSPRDAHQPREVVSEAKAKLRASRFRSLNEKLYTQTGKESFDMFKGSGQGEGTDGAFKAYHEGFAEQVKKWPINPLDHIINSIRKRLGSCVGLIIKIIIIITDDNYHDCCYYYLFFIKIICLYKTIPSLQNCKRQEFGGGGFWLRRSEAVPDSPRML